MGVGGGWGEGWNTMGGEREGRGKWGTKLKHLGGGGGGTKGEC